MQYYTERHGMRIARTKTYDISIDAYSLLFDCCDEYLISLGWRYPEECKDGCGCSGVDFQRLQLDLRYEIPTFFRNEEGILAKPLRHNNVFDGETCDEYDQYALLDYIEFISCYCKDYHVTGFHSYYGHNHYSYKETSSIFYEFQNKVNDIFEKTGLLYRLTEQRQIEREITNSPLNRELENQVDEIKEEGLKELLKEAIDLYKRPYPESMRDATEKIWDAYERLKTYYTELSKKDSASKIIQDVSLEQPEFYTLIDNEFKNLTSIGNDFRIRHHETNRINIVDSRHYEYLFNRCLSIISLALDFLI